MGLGNDFVRGHVDENAARQGEHDGKRGGGRRGKHVTEDGAQRDGQATRGYHEQPAPRRYARQAQGRAHDHAFADVLDADRNDKQPTQARSVPSGEARADGKPLGNTVDAECADDSVAAPELLVGFAVVVTFEPDVAVVPARVPVGDEAVHERRNDHPEKKTEHNLAEHKDVETGRTLYAGQSLGKQTQGCGREHEARTQTQDAVVGAARESSKEKKWKGPQASGQAGQASSG